MKDATVIFGPEIDAAFLALIDYVELDDIRTALARTSGEHLFPQFFFSITRILTSGPPVNKGRFNQGFDVPEINFLLGIIYNDSLHLRAHQDNYSRIVSKLENNTIKNMIKTI